MFSLGPGTSEAVEERRGGGHTDLGTQHLTCRLGEGVCLEHRGSRSSSPQTLRNTAHCCLDGIAEHISVHVPILGLFILPPGWGYPENHLPLTQWVRANAPDKRKPTQNLCTYRRFARQVKDYVFPQAWVA